MKTPQERLREVRQLAGFKTAAEAARAMGVKEPTYHGHENGHGGKITREPFERYAKFFRVDLDWLLTGKGAMRRSAATTAIRVHGYVTAGAEVCDYDPAIAEAQQDHVEIQPAGAIAALEVEGESMWPRFLPGEFILFEIEPTLPKNLVDQYAIVQTVDMRRLVKILRRGRSESRWRLESHNAPPLEEVELMAAWRYCGVIPPQSLVLPPGGSRIRRVGHSRGGGSR